VKPPVPYFGGKITLGPAIASLLPDHGHYVEPYCGSLAVLLAKQPSPHETVNDLDGALMTFWRVLRDRPADLERVCTLTPHSRAEHRASYEPAVDELETARRVWVQLTQGRSGIRRGTGWRHFQDPSNSSLGMPAYLTGYVARICPAAERLAAVSLESMPALDLIGKYGRDEDVLLYVDPPYLPSARSSGSYLHEMTTTDHHDLAAALRAARATVVLSGYPSDLYDHELYPDWHRRTFDASTGQGGTWANRTEVLWSNRPLADNQPTLWDHAEEVAG
jgi:DNA adenine methylase